MSSFSTAQASGCVVQGLDHAHVRGPVHVHGHEHGRDHDHGHDHEEVGGASTAAASA
jgi:hypothetical protein